jgi:hypothetical protein
VVAVLLTNLPLEHIGQATSTRRRQDVTLVVVETNFKDVTVVAKVHGHAAGADDVDVTELHSLIELEVSEDAE